MLIPSDSDSLSSDVPESLFLQLHPTVNKIVVIQDWQYGHLRESGVSSGQCLLAENHRPLRHPLHRPRPDLVLGTYLRGRLRRPRHTRGRAANAASRAATRRLKMISPAIRSARFWASARRAALVRPHRLFLFLGGGDLPRTVGIKFLLRQSIV